MIYFGLLTLIFSNEEPEEHVGFKNNRNFGRQLK